eukprot:TRINITY_DN8279_c0_g1_i1.p1 TRINITY_DN8279_c0_g1~~TRINITY_DN8279_c0_g1_i1.p1  ORF type:complete len:312 (-),score=32.90 TRINITY_DN8279_c0_g1_i1:112-1047(-)
MMCQPTRVFSPRQHMGDRGIPYSGDRVESLKNSESFDDLTTYSLNQSFLKCPQPVRPKSPSVRTSQSRRNGPLKNEIAACFEIEQILSSRRRSSPDILNFRHLDTPLFPNSDIRATTPTSLESEFRPQLGESIEIPEFTPCPSPIQRTGSAPLSQLQNYSETLVAIHRPTNPSPIHSIPSSGPILSGNSSPTPILRPVSPTPSAHVISEPFVVPPARCSNPIVINEPFVACRGRENSAEIGLLSVSPTPMSPGQKMRRSASSNVEFKQNQSFDRVGRGRQIIGKEPRSGFRRFDLVSTDHTAAKQLLTTNY